MYIYIYVAPPVASWPPPHPARVGLTLPLCGGGGGAVAASDPTVVGGGRPVAIRRILRKLEGSPREEIEMRKCT